MLLNKSKSYRIILASGSPRRRELLNSLGLDFEVHDGFHSDENYPDGMKGEEIPVYLARNKSLAYPETLNEKDILITADTIVYQEGEVLMKPETAGEAYETLRKISGRSHFVYTGVCLRSLNRTTEFCSSTEVIFGKLSDIEIEYYISNYKPFDKAGAYGIQEWIGYVGVEEIRGSYFNVMGLPIHKLYRELELFIK